MKGLGTALGPRGASEQQEIAQLRRRLAEAEEKLARSEGRGPTGGLGEDVSVFFMVGVPKSGTTWLRRMLDAHPEVFCKGEGRFFGRNDKDLNFENVQSNNLGRLLRPGSLHHTLAECQNLRVWLERTWWTRDGDADEHIARITGDAVRYFISRKLAIMDKKIIGDKTPLQKPETVTEVGALLPDARVIHIIRDGRDQAISHAHHRWNRVRPVEEGGRLTPEEQDKRDRYRQDPEGFLASGESIFSEQHITTAAQGWARKVGATHRDGPAVLGDKYAEVRYEDLLERPEEEMGRLFRFLGAGHDVDVVRRAVESNSFEEASDREAGSENSSSFFRKGVAGDWRSVFTERDKAIFKRETGELLVELGYETNLDW
jgi:hypothetical protein